MNQKSLYILHFIILLLLVLFILFVPVPYAQAEGLPKAKSGKWISVTTTAYSKAETCPRETCITANGSEPIPFRTAACPRNIPFGRHFLVTGLKRGGIYWNGTFVCTDRTSRRYDGRFDLFASGHKEAINFGKQKLTIFLYDEHSK